MELISIGKFAKMVGVTPTTLRTMLKAVKIRLKPTKEQEILLWRSCGAARWSYNYYLAEREKAYNDHVTNGRAGKFIFREGDVRKYINRTLKPTTHKWLREVGSNVMKQAVKDADEAYRRYLNGISGRPKFKSRHRSKPSFYVNYESFTKKNGGCHCEKIGFIKTAVPLPRLPKSQTHYSNPRISYDGKYWYVSFGMKVEACTEPLTDVSVGIDLGVKNLAVCSNGRVYENINRSKRIRHLKKRSRREQRKLSRMLERNIKEYKTVGKKRFPVWIKPLTECRNIQKQNNIIRLLYKRISDIRQDHIHQATNEIVKTKPSRIVMEDLNVRGMMKNRHLAKAIAEQKFHEFLRQIEYKSALKGIQFIKADRFYPSSKLCSCCGAVKKDLKLSDRTYKCDKCGSILDRDYNASINLANYRSA